MAMSTAAMDAPPAGFWMSEVPARLLVVSVPGVSPAQRDRFEARTLLARRRQELNLGQEQLARLAGVSLSSLRRLEAAARADRPGDRDGDRTGRGV